MYYKILADNLTHHGFTYHEGLNVDPNPFEPNLVYKNGLFFADEKHIFENLAYGNHIARIIIPAGEEVIKIGNQYKAHQIILKDIKPLWNLEMFKQLVLQGVDIHANENLALVLAAEKGYYDLVIYLVKQGADIHAYADSAFCYAAENGHFDIVKYLVEKGSNIHACDDYAVKHAKKNGYFNIVKYLIRNGATLEEENPIVIGENVVVDEELPFN